MTTSEITIVRFVSARSIQITMLYRSDGRPLNDNTRYYHQYNIIIIIITIYQANIAKRSAHITVIILKFKIIIMRINNLVKKLIYIRKPALRSRKKIDRRKKKVGLKFKLCSLVVLTNLARAKHFQNSTYTACCNFTRNY